MPIGTSDALVRVKALKKLAYTLSGKSLDAEAFDILLRNIYSDVWVLINPNVLAQKSDKVPTQQLLHLISEMSRQRLVVSYKCMSEDYTRSCYIVRLNARQIQRTCRRKTHVYVMYMLNKKIKHLNGDKILVDPEKCGTYWEDFCVFKNESNGSVGSIPYVDMHKFEWESML